MSSIASLYRCPLRAAKRALFASAASAALVVVMAAPAAADCVPIQCEKPDATTGSPANITATSATLTATVNTHGTSNGRWSFEFGPNDANMTVAGTGVVDDRNGPQSVSLNVTGLRPGTNYQYRVSFSTSWPNSPVRGDFVTFGTPLQASSPAAAPAPAAPPAAPAAPPAPAAPARVDPLEFSSGSPSRLQGTAPYRYHVRGRLDAPAGLTGFCHGTVTITFKRGSQTVATRKAELGQSAGACRYDKDVTVNRSRLSGHGWKSLRVLARFDGNEKLNGASASDFSVSYRAG
jgi:hypothetical protein